MKIFLRKCRCKCSDLKKKVNGVACGKEYVACGKDIACGIGY
jgi:hypothetical protein